MFQNPGGSPERDLQHWQHVYPCLKIDLDDYAGSGGQPGSCDCRERQCLARGRETGGRGPSAEPASQAAAAATPTGEIRWVDPKQKNR